MSKPKYEERICKTHGRTDFVLEGRGYYRCKQCRSDAVTKRRRNVKSRLVEYLGGRCKGCGYDRCEAALEFHHKDGDKEFGIANNGHTVAFEKLKTEAEKCILLCANCHREVHAGVRTIE